MDLETVQSQAWDVIIIGAGMGGGLAGRRLAEAGLSVLFVEKGPVGYRTEEQDLGHELTDPIARQLRGGWPKPFEANIDGRVSQFYGPVGCGVGGSSVFYAGALERPEPHDLDDLPERPHPAGGWPADYVEFRRYFDEAEDILHVCGAQDPLSDIPSPMLKDPPPLTDGDVTMKADFEGLGLHPYRLHSSLLYVKNCRNCIGHKCPRHCKMDGRSAGVEPALAAGAGLLTNCDVKEFLEDGEQITGVRVVQDGVDVVLQARSYLLAAGTFGSARLLLSSTSHSSAGCANSSGWVGRGLMFHLHENFALWPKKHSGFEDAGKSFSLRDLYFVKGKRYGLVQSMGLDASYGNIVYFLNQVFDRSALRKFRSLRHLTRIPAFIAARIFGNAKVLVGLIEDLAYFENRVFLHPGDPDILAFEYTIHDELRRRRQDMLRMLRKAFKGHRKFFLGLQPELDFGHASGTLRFGNDPETSVLDRDCKAHDLSNLYVADASFMRSSMGVNPSLTIGANALRVADILAARLKQERTERGQ